MTPEEACEVLVDLLAESEQEDDEEPEEASGHQKDTQKHEGLFMKLAVLMAGVFLVSFGGVMYFVYRIHTDSIPPKNEPVQNQDYDKLLRELEELRKLQEEAQQTPPQQNNMADYSELIEMLQKCMVYIDADKVSRVSTGSGFIVSRNGDILTNYHVIKDARSIIAALYDSKPVEALIKDFDADKDIALIQAKTINDSSPIRTIVSPCLQLSDTLPNLGERILSISNPRGFQGTVSDGIVSAYRKDDKNNVWIQFSAPVSHGSSGGALFNMQGEVVGMTTLGDEGGQNLNFAVPCDVLSDFLSSAINKSARTPLKPKTYKTPSRTQSRQITKAPKSSKGSGIPLPDVKGFLVHKWGCSVESIRRYVSAPLIDFGDGIYSTRKKFKAYTDKLDTLVFITYSQRDVEPSITREITNLYGTPAHSGYNNYEGIGNILERTWYTSGLVIHLTRNVKWNTVTVKFSPR